MSGDTLREHLPEISVPLLECLDGNSVYLNRFDGKIFDQHRILPYFNGNLFDSRITNLISRTDTVRESKIGSMYFHIPGSVLISLTAISARKFHPAVRVQSRLLRNPFRTDI
jgi:hypothetical protein